MVYPKLRDASRDESCVRCGAVGLEAGVVGAHYTGARRLAYGGGLGIKVHDAIMADLCGRCHREMDTLSRNKEGRWEHSEEFLHLVALTIIRRIERGVLVVA